MCGYRVDVGVVRVCGDVGWMWGTVYKQSNQVSVPALSLKGNGKCMV